MILSYAKSVATVVFSVTIPQYLMNMISGAAWAVDVVVGLAMVILAALRAARGVAERSRLKVSCLNCLWSTFVYLGKQTFISVPSLGFE